MNDYFYSENDLNINLNEYVNETLREFYLASKKVSIYSATHPLSRKAIGHIFLMMDKLFKYKKYINLHIASGNLYALNIRMRRSVFTDQIMEFMQILDLSDILFEWRLTVDDLSLFLERLVKKLPISDYRNLMTSWLEEHKIDTIHINSEIGQQLFEHGIQFYGDLPDDFSVRTLVGQVIGSDYEMLVDLLANEKLDVDDLVRMNKYDYHPALIRYLISEKIAAMPKEKIIDVLGGRILSALESHDIIKGVDPAELNKAREMIAALNYHPQREDILNKIGNIILEKGIGRDIYADLLPKTSAIKIESSEKIDQFLYATFNDALPGYNLDEFQDIFSRLLRTGQEGKARSVVNILINHLAGPDLNFRKYALILFHHIFEVYPKTTAGYLLDHIIIKINEYTADGRDTFEFSDLIWELALATLKEKNYRQLDALCGIIEGKRSCHEGVWTYESVALKKAIEELNRREIIAQLVNDLVSGSGTVSQLIKHILVTIGSEEVALALSHIISHESRQVRMMVLKILSEMGRASLVVFSDILKNENFFEREAGKRELPDDKWYVIRNSIFVLGSLKDPDACPALRMVISDEDTRVRLAVVQALEKIGGDKAVDLLLMAANDKEHEVREAALIALGLTGNMEIVPELIDIAEKQPSEIINAIVVLGKLGGNDAKKFLSCLLNDRQWQSKFTSGRSSRDDLRLATIKALGRIGDTESLSSIKQFNESMKASQKILFGGSKLSRAAEDVLNRDNK
nr:HEAT repeat domain-containing protein [candidate division Zixibacteria bacterium]